MSVADKQPLLLTAREAAAQLAISERTLLRESTAGRIPSVRVRKRRLYSVEALRRWIETQQAGASAK